MPKVQTKFKTMYLVNHLPEPDKGEEQVSGVESVVTTAGPSTYNCQHCSEKFLDETSLTNHIRDKHSGSITYDCPHCTYETTNFEEMQTHLSEQHPHPPTDTPKNTEDIEKCDNCDGEKDEVVQRNTLILRGKRPNNPTPKYYPYPKLQKKTNQIKLTINSKKRKGRSFDGDDEDDEDYTPYKRPKLQKTSNKKKLT